MTSERVLQYERNALQLEERSLLADAPFLRQKPHVDQIAEFPVAKDRLSFPPLFPQTRVSGRARVPGHWFPKWRVWPGVDRTDRTDSPGHTRTCQTHSPCVGASAPHP